ncbi:hypothetical protein B0H13DRAFT_2384243 [Mycena leptocephala]|nr:hypothetical protein B0H13DRAFT_2384243 [Mycena leptocephala]
MSNVLTRASLIPLDNFLGAWFIGIVVSSVLFGVTCLQVYLYFTVHCARDPVFLKSFVVILLGLDTLHLALLSHSFYFSTVTNFGDYNELGITPWSLLVSTMRDSTQFVQLTGIIEFIKVQSAIGVLLAALVQLFYAFRIYIMSNKSLVFPVIIGFCTLAESGMGIAFMNKGFHTKYYKDAQSDTPYSTSALSFEVFCDVVIASAMVYYLLRNKTEIQTTNRAINLLVLYTVVRNLHPCDMGNISYDFDICIVLFYPFYGLSFMSILNSREYIREQLFATSISHAMVTIPSYNPNDSSLPVHANTNGFDKVSSGGI